LRKNDSKPEKDDSEFENSDSDFDDCVTVTNAVNNRSIVAKKGIQRLYRSRQRGSTARTASATAATSFSVAGKMLQVAYNGMTVAKK
jgi:hypothetical protein